MPIDRMLRSHGAECIGDTTVSDMWKVRSGADGNHLRLPPRGFVTVPGRGDSLGDDALFEGEPDEIGRAAEAKCLKEMRFVVLDGPDGDVEIGRDFLHALALRQQAQHVALPGREL